MSVKRTPEQFLEIAPLDPGGGRYRINAEAALKGVAALASLLLGLKGGPAAIGHLAGALKAITRQTRRGDKIAAQGFALYVIALTRAIRTTIETIAPAVELTQDSTNEIAGIIVGCLRKEPLFLSQRFFRKPGLNPGFVRVRESLLSILSKLDSITDQQIERVGIAFGSSILKRVI